MNYDVEIIDQSSNRGFEQIVKYGNNNQGYCICDLSRYFTESHKLTRRLNKELINKWQDLPDKSLLLSLIKLSDKELFECVRLLLIVDDFKSKGLTVSLTTVRYSLLLSVASILDYSLGGVILCNRNGKYNPFNYYKNKLGKLVLFLLNSFKVKSFNESKVFVLYDNLVSFEYAKPYLKNAVAYPYLTGRSEYKNVVYNFYSNIDYKYICPKLLLKSLSRFIRNRKYVSSSPFSKPIKKVFLKHLVELEINLLCFESLVEKSNGLNSIIGLFDAFSSIDYITKELNDGYNVKTVCIPHGVNFKDKVHYISYGVNTYTFWGEDHFQRLSDSVLFSDEPVVKKITGNILFEKTINKYKPSCIDGKRKTILIVGEYYSKDGFYSSPFNEEHTRRMMSTIKSVVSGLPDVDVVIRTRLKDRYAEVCQEFSSENITIVEPIVPIEEDILNSSVVISIFSNVLHEALLLKRHVIQVNMFGIENYRDLAQDKLVTYATSEKELSESIVAWSKNDTFEPDFELHESKYCNNGKFYPLDMMVD